MERYLSIKELTGLLGVSRATIYRLKSKGLPYIKVGKLIRFSKERVIDWLYEQKKKAERAKTILQVGVYRCVACGIMSRVTEPILRKKAQCPHCKTKSRLEFVKGSPRI